MATGAKYDVKFRREREMKTNYGTRLAFVKAPVPRLVVRVSNKNILCQLVKYEADGDKVLAMASSMELAKLGWKSSRSNTPAAYLVGYLCAKKAIAAKQKKAILDIGFKGVVKGSKVFAALKGALDAGLEMPHDESVLPSQERIEGAHINEKMKSEFAVSKKKIDSI